MKVLAVLAAGLATCGAAATTSAAVTDFNVTANTSVVPGYVVNDLFISFSGQLTNNQILTTGLGVGNIYQDALGSNTAPNSAFVGLVPTLGDDTFVHYGAARSESGDAVTPSFAGGAVNLGGGAALTFNNATIDAAYFIPGGNTVSDKTNYFVGRLTFLGTADGTLEFLASAGGISTFEYSIVNGQIVVPEPASAALLGFGTICVFARSRRS